MGVGDGVSGGDGSVWVNKRIDPRIYTNEHDLIPESWLSTKDTKKTAANNSRLFFLVSFVPFVDIALLFVFIREDSWIKVFRERLCFRSGSETL